MNNQRRGLTLIEAIITTVITAVLLVAAMNATGAAVRFRTSTANRAIAQKLADGLMNDILALPYSEPNGGAVAFGPESGESTTSKVNWDDVDDFNGWSESPPQDRSGNVMSDLSGWTRTVKVERVSMSNPATVSSTESGAKRVTVNVLYNSKAVCTRVALRTAAP